MANIKIIDLPTGSPESTSFVEATQVDLLSETGRSTVKLALNALGNFVAGQDASPLEYGDLETESTNLIGGINELHGVDGYDVYDNTATYAVGDVCIHSNSLQVCTTAVTVAEDFDSNKWSPTTIKALLALKQNITDNSLTTNNKQIVPAINELNYLSDIKRIEAQAEHQTCGAGQTIVVNFTVSVPTGYKVIGAWDQSYWAGVLGVPIIATDSGAVSFNYFSPSGFTDRLLRAMVVLAKNVNR